MKNDIKIFNEVLYQNCFFQGVAHVAYNHGFLDDLFLNDYFVYEYDFNNIFPRINFEVKTFFPWREILSNNSIHTEDVEYDDKLIPKVCRALDTGSMVFMPMDCFYEDIRVDCYQKTHVAHWIIIYDYSKRKKVFKIIEHNYINDMKYIPQTIGFEVVENANKGYAELKKLKNPKYLVFSKKNIDSGLEYEKPKALDGFINYQQSILNMGDFINEFKSDMNAEKLNEYAIQYKRMFENIYRNKKYQKYWQDTSILKYLTQDSEIAAGIFNNSTINDWGAVIGNIYKDFCCKKITEETLERLVKQLETIYKKELEISKYITMLQTEF